MFNRYAYTFNDPINLTDPDGNRPQPPPESSFSHKVKLAGQGFIDTVAHGIAGMSRHHTYNQPQRAILSQNDAMAYASGAGLGIAAGLIGPSDEAVVGKGIANGVFAVGDEAKSALSGLNLQKQLASEAQMADLASGGGIVLGQPAKQAPRIAAETGIDAANIQKVSSDSFVAKDGQAIQTHSFRDGSTNKLIEPKTIINENP